MGAPLGNRFWELRAKHGRDKLFETPELLKQAAEEYFTWCVDNPLIAIEYYGKDAERCEVPKVRAFTIQGLCLYLQCNINWFSEFERNNTDKDFSCILSHIRQCIYNQKFEHAAAGFLNANLIARDLGIADKNVNETTMNINSDALEAIAAKLNGSAT